VRWEDRFHGRSLFVPDAQHRERVPWPWPQRWPRSNNCPCRKVRLWKEYNRTAARKILWSGCRRNRKL